jgi:hypothetical protein
VSISLPAEVPDAAPAQSAESELAPVKEVPR